MSRFFVINDNITIGLVDFGVDEFPCIAIQRREPRNDNLFGTKGGATIGTILEVRLVVCSSGAFAGDDYTATKIGGNRSPLGGVFDG